MKLRDLTPFCFTEGSGCGRSALAEAPASPPAGANTPATAGPSVPGAVVAAVRPTAREKVTFATDVFHAQGGVAIPADGQARLDDLAVKASGLDLEVIIAVGHASADEGTVVAAQRLSERRAEAVKQYLVSRGIAANRVYTEGKGATQPVGDNRTAEGRAKNRRVELEAVGTRRSTS